MELEFDVLGVTRKLVNHVVYLSKKLKLRNIISLYTRCPNKGSYG